MKMMSGSKMVSNAIDMHRILTKNNFGIDELMRIYIATPLSDHFKQNASMGGYVPHRKRTRKIKYFV